MCCTRCVCFQVYLHLIAILNETTGRCIHLVLESEDFSSFRNERADCSLWFYSVSFTILHSECIICSVLLKATFPLCLSNQAARVYESRHWINVSCHIYAPAVTSHYPLGAGEKKVPWSYWESKSGRPALTHVADLKYGGCYIIVHSVTLDLLFIVWNLCSWAIVFIFCDFQLNFSIIWSCFICIFIRILCKGWYIGNSSHCCFLY